MIRHFEPLVTFDLIFRVVNFSLVGLVAALLVTVPLFLSLLRRRDERLWRSLGSPRFLTGQTAEFGKFVRTAAPDQLSDPALRRLFVILKVESTVAVVAVLASCVVAGIYWTDRWSHGTEQRDVEISATETQPLEILLAVGAITSIVTGLSTYWRIKHLYPEEWRAAGSPRPWGSIASNRKLARWAKSTDWGARNDLTTLWLERVSRWSRRGTIALVLVMLALALW